MNELTMIEVKCELGTGYFVSFVGAVPDPANHPECIQVKDRKTCVKLITAVKMRELGFTVRDKPIS